jgi:penicillin-binding protein 1A
MFLSCIRYFFMLFFISAACASGALIFLLYHNGIDFSVLEHYNPGKPSIVLDDEGNEWARFQLDRREPIDITQMPQSLINAFLAAEDWHFFSHNGISWRGIARSMVVNAYHGRIVQGASTITQQLVKLLFLDSQRTFSRKIKEQLCALVVERRFTKEQILQTYLNHVYFGAGIYGVEAASQRFWAKRACDLDVDEAAILAGIVRNPGRYCPLIYPLSSQKRRNIVLRSMHQQGFIDDATYEYARKKEVIVVDQDAKGDAPHLKESLRIMLEDLVGKEQLYSGGLIIQSTLNMYQQRQAQKIFHEHCLRLKETVSDDIDGALITMDNKTGEIKALIGGFDFAASKFNRAFQARRQLGSVIKPLIYAAALQSGMNFANTQIDEPIEFAQTNNKVWAPRNYDRKFEGEVSLAWALSHSNNIVAIKLLQEVGAKKIHDLAKQARLQGPFHSYLSLALGTIDTTLKEAVGLFNIFANNGVYVEPYYIKWIKDEWGTKIYKSSPEKERVLDTYTSGRVAKVLELSLKRIRKYFPNQWFDSEGISKTGTTNDSRICWYVGSTPSLTTGIHIGCDDNRSMGVNIYPFRTALPIWLAFNRAVPSVQKTFTYDPSLHEVRINKYTGQLVWDERDPDAITIFV